MVVRGRYTGASSSITDGTAQGQILFWDDTLGEWTYTETTELIWDDTAKILKPVALTVTGSAVLGLNSAIFQPTIDSATFFQVKDQDGNVFLIGDSVNNKTISNTFDATDEDNALQIDGTTILRTGTAANFNMFLGESFAGDEGVNNIGVGATAGQNNSIVGGGVRGTNNVYIGYRAGLGFGTTNTGYYNVGIGTEALYFNESGNNCFGLGFSACRKNTTGLYNIGIGAAALRDNGIGSRNTGIGASCQERNLSGSHNFAVGFYALRYNKIGQWNVALGNYAIEGVVNMSLNGNACIGYRSGRLLSTGSYNVFLGYNSGVNQVTNSNLLIIDNQDRSSAANEAVQCLLYGTFAATPEAQELRINGALTLGNLEDGHYTQVEADGTLEFNGDATVWDDYVTPLTRAAFGGAANDPKLTKLFDDGAASAGVWALVFSNGDEVLVTAQMPHSWKVGSTIYPHIHFMCDSDVDPTDKFGINFEYTWCDIGEDFAANTTLVNIDIDTGVDTDNMHQIANVTPAGIDGSGHTLSSVLLCRIERVAAAGDDYAGGVAILEFDIHFEKDTVGSRQITTK